jgi:hypothetical protein
MTKEAQRRPHVPYVVGAPQRVADRARTLGLGGCLENAVAEAILRDALCGRGRQRVVTLAADGTRSGRDRPGVFRVIVEHRRSPFGRRGWCPIAIERVTR